MIKLIRLDGSEMYLNPDLIEIIEETPDTHVTLSNGNKYVVLDAGEVIVDKIVTYKAGILHRSLAGSTRKYLRKKRAENYRPQCRLERDKVE